MQNILQLIQTETDGTCYTSYRYCVDEELRLPSIVYEESEKYTILKNQYGETDSNLKHTKDMTVLANKIINDEPLFRFFLDGSRRVYKVDDIQLNKRIYPIIAGQIGVACCERRSPAQFGCAEIDSNLVLSLPTIASSDTRNAEQFFNALTNKINLTKRLQNSPVKFSKTLTYSSNAQDDTKKYENLGIATIQDEMVESEKRIISFLYTKKLLTPQHYLIKDGSLQYKPMKAGDHKELTKFKNHYRSVVGVSKMFNPELSKDRDGKSNSERIARLEKFHRTPAFMYQSDIVGNVKFAIWYVRIREAKYTDSPFSGVVKIEKILITDDEIENGLDSAEVDLITANIINERNPVCYGNDKRWANHLYPIYLTESFIKSKYLSDIHFLSLF